MSRFIELVSFEEALNRIRETEWVSQSTEFLEPAQAAGRITVSEITAKEDCPSWNRSLVDGFAVKSVDCKGASETNPVVFSPNGVVEAGSSTYTDYIEGHCTEIYTGGLLPPDYDAVVMAEDVEISGNSVRIYKSVKPWENVERKGDDIPKGLRIINKAETVRPWHISAMISSGVRTIQVFKKIRIGIIATGNELFEGSEGHIPNTTQRIYADYLDRPFLVPETAGIAHDSVNEIRGLVEVALAKYDCIIVTGGTSLGGKDEVPEAMSASSNVVFAGSMIRPGRTLTLYEVKGKPVFSVSGIPIPSLLSFDTYFEEYLKKVTGITTYRVTVSGKLVEPVSNRAGYAGIYRIKYVPDRDGGTVEVVKAKGTGSLGSILNSNGTLTLPGGIEGLPAGSTVLVKLFGDVI